MREILIDESSFSQPEDVHAYLACELEFPSYYGANLDALNDCLGDVSEEIRCTVYMTDAFDAAAAEDVHMAGAAGVHAADASSADVSGVAASGADVSDAAASGAGALVSWFPKLVRSLLRAARENENLEVLVHATSLDAFARLAACPGVADLLQDKQYIVQGIIAHVGHQEEIFN